MRGLDLSHNKLTTRAGEYISEAIKSEYKIHYLNFKENNLEPTGTWRIIESVNSNHNIQMLDLGIISDVGLELLTNLLKDN